MSPQNRHFQLTLLKISQYSQDIYPLYTALIWAGLQRAGLVLSCQPQIHAYLTNSACNSQSQVDKTRNDKFYQFRHASMLVLSSCAWTAFAHGTHLLHGPQSKYTKTQWRQSSGGYFSLKPEIASCTCNTFVRDKLNSLWPVPCSLH